MILRMLPGPFFGWLGTLMFLLLMQFLIRYLPDIAGRGLPLWVIIELIAYNLAYMMVLAVPMSALLTSLMAFGRLAESNAYAVIKNSGISLPQLLWPVLIVGILLTGGMNYFNNVVLPEANFRARNLWQDIRTKRPDFELQPGIFYEGIQDYSIRVLDLNPETGQLSDITIFDYTEGTQRRATIKAEQGYLKAYGLYADLILERGEIHRLIQASGIDTKERYERLGFDRYRLRLDLSEFAFERSDPGEGYRSDRTTPTTKMIRFVDSLEVSIAGHKERLQNIGMALQADSNWIAAPTDEPMPLAAPATDDTVKSLIKRAVVTDLEWRVQQRIYDNALEQARKSRSEVDDLRRTIVWETQRADRYRVEIHKKYSIALACLIFMLIGAPLGLSIRRGGLGTVGGLALAIFMFYWITLVQGEKLADRGHLIPWVGMWAANILMVLIGLWLILYVALDLRATPPLRKRFRSALCSKNP